MIITLVALTEFDCVEGFDTVKWGCCFLKKSKIAPPPEGQNHAYSSKLSPLGDQFGRDFMVGNPPRQNFAQKATAPNNRIDTLTAVIFCESAKGVDQRPCEGRLNACVGKDAGRD